MFYKLPEKARTELICDAYVRPMTLQVVAFEVRNNTDKGKELLKILGYEDD
jgi:hypothetical protein